MAAIPAVDFPFHLANGVKSSSFDLVTVNLTSRGMFSGKQITGGPLYQLWQATLPMDQLTETQWRELSALVPWLYASKTPVRLFDPLRQRPLGRVSNATPSSAADPWSDGSFFSDGTGWDSNYYDGLVIAEAAAGGAETIRFSGAVASEVLAVAAGDLFEVNGYLYMAAANARSNSAGEGRISIRPRLREGVAVGDGLKFGRARGTFQITNADGFSLNRASVTRWGAATLTFTEMVG